MRVKAPGRAEGRVTGDVWLVVKLSPPPGTENCRPNTDNCARGNERFMYSHCKRLFCVSKGIFLLSCAPAYPASEPTHSTPCANIFTFGKNAGRPARAKKRQPGTGRCRLSVIGQRTSSFPRSKTDADGFVRSNQLSRPGCRRNPRAWARHALQPSRSKLRSMTTRLAARAFSNCGTRRAGARTACARDPK